jgi:hypothetical protein
MAVRFSFEHLSYVLLVAGALAAVGGDRLSMVTVRDVGLALAFLGVMAFGLDMIVKRRAEIATRYSSTVSPAFHVFQGWAAVAWGASIALFAAMILGYAVIELMEWTSVRIFFAERPGILIAMGGVIVTAWGLGSAGRATYRRGATEMAASRLGDRIGGIIAVPFGLCILGIGLLRTFAPASAEALYISVRDWLIGLIPR